MRSIELVPLALPLLCGALAGGCGSSPFTERLVPPIEDLPSASSIVPTLLADDATPAVADPSLPGFTGWPITFRARPPARVTLRCELTVARGTTEIATLEGTLEGGLCTGAWDGLEGGAPASVGPASITARLLDGSEVRATVVQPIEIVRLGIDRIDVRAEGRAPLLYRRTAGRRGDFTELPASAAPFAMGPDAPGESALELADGTRRATPTPWNDVLTPPVDAGDADGVEDDTFDLPSAIVAGAEVTLEARLSTEAAGGASGDPTLAEVRVIVAADDVAPAISGQDRVAHGNVLTIEHGATPVPAVGRFDRTYTFAFEARRPGGAFQPVPGALPITLRFYGLAGAPTFFDASLPHRTWVDVIDRIAEWVNGETGDPTEVGARLVEGVYYELGLRYDTARGASFYTDYARANFGEAVFDMQAFEERDDGEVVNCSDAASILSSYANMVGLDFRYHILTHRSASGFDLNFIQAIGGSRFDDTPFDSGRGGFSYHAIVGGRDGATWDATLAVDGDGAPAALPATLTLVQHMVPTDYLEALSSEASQIQTTRDDRVRIR